jgi:hypothetical protein
MERKEGRVAGLLVVATSDGVRVLQRGREGYDEVAGGLTGRRVTSVTAGKYAVLAGTPDGVFISRSNGESWEEPNDGLAEPHVRWLAYHLNDPWLAFAGTEPAAIFVSTDILSP